MQKSRGKMPNTTSESNRQAAPAPSLKVAISQLLEGNRAAGVIDKHHALVRPSHSADFRYPDGGFPSGSLDLVPLFGWGSKENFIVVAAARNQWKELPVLP